MITLMEPLRDRRNRPPLTTRIPHFHATAGTTARYIEINPVNAGLVLRPEEYKWSSAKAHLHGEDDILVKAGPLLDMVPVWKELPAKDLSAEEYETLRRHERNGRPLGNENFIAKLEKMTARVLVRQKPGPKKK